MRIVFLTLLVFTQLPLADRVYSQENEVIQQNETLNLNYSDLRPLLPGTPGQFLYNRNFENQLDYTLNQIRQRHPKDLQAALTYLEAFYGSTKQAREIPVSGLKNFLCRSRASIVKGETTFRINLADAKKPESWRIGVAIDKAPETTFPCTIGSGSEEIVVTNGAVQIGDNRTYEGFLTIPFSSGGFNFYGAPFGGLGAYLVDVVSNANSVDTRGWARYRTADFILFQLDAGVELFKNGPSRVVFDFNQSLRYFRTRFSVAFDDVADPLSGRLVEKTFAANNLIAYDSQTNVAIDFPVISLQEVVSVVAGTGKFVAYDRSSFEPSIGTFTYPWQILFHTDVYPNFARYLYGDLFPTAAFNENWIMWANFIAGEGDKDTLRSSSFFRNQFKFLEIEGAIK
jgi:hypothetical protein